MKKCNRRSVMAMGLAGLLLAGTVYAITEGDAILTQDYVDDTLVPQMEAAVTQHIQDYMEEGYTASVAQLDAVQLDGVTQLEEAILGESTSIVPVDFGQGDRLTLSQGASLLVTDGRAQLTHDGVVVDATTGETCASGSYTQTGHRYIVAENTTCTVTVVSGLAKLGYEGSYRYSSGTGKNHPFYDVYSFDSYNDGVTFVYSNGLFNGVGDGRFAPADSMTRAMVMTVLYRLAGEPADQLAAADVAFSDVPEGEWYSDPIFWGASQGVTQGVGGGLFAPDDSVTLVQMIQFLYNFGEKLGLDMSGTADLSTVTGGDTVPDWGTEAAQWAVANGIWIYSLSDRTAMRAEVAVMVTNFAQLYG